MQASVDCLSTVPDLRTGDVHLWILTISEKFESKDELLGLLSSDELTRYRNYRFEKDKNLYLAGRATLRKVLGHYLQTAPRDLNFTYGEFGKPAILHNPLNLKFNLSNTLDTIAISVTVDSLIGVDIEYKDLRVDHLELASFCFSDDELHQLRQLSPSQLVDGFYNGWSRKEAFIKAIGVGLSISLKSFDVELCSRQKPKLKRVNYGQEDCSQWSLESFSPREGLAGAIAIRAKNYQLKTLCRAIN